MDSRKTKSIGHDELQLAIRKFQKRGGIIQKLPDQKSFTHQAVGVKEGQATVASDAAT